MEDLLNYNIESILSNRIEDVFPHHQRIVDACDAFWNDVYNSVNRELVHESDIAAKIKNNTTVIVEITNRIQYTQDQSGTVEVDQKLCEKQMNTIINQQPKLKEEINELSAQGERYVVEIAESQQELEECKMRKKLKWDAIKRACNIYKSALECGINVIDLSEDYDKIRFSFFKSPKAENSQYYVELTRTTDLWKVDLIHPSLEPNHEEQLKYVVNSKNQQEISDLTAFLCVLRKIFKQLRES